jgi:hypothetical protein
MGEQATDLLSADDLWFGKARLVECLNVVLHALAQRKAFGPSRAA